MPPLIDDAWKAAVAFLTRYGPVTRRSYTIGSAGLVRLVPRAPLEVLAVQRPHAELWARDMEEHHRLATSTISRRRSTICCFFRFAMIDGFIDRNPAEFVRRPKVDQESTTSAWTGWSWARSSPKAPPPAPSITPWPASSGCSACECRKRVSVDVEHLGLEQGHRTLWVIGKGHKPPSSRCRPGSPAPSTSPRAAA